MRRRKFQGVWNIVRFNWHFYVFTLGFLLLLLLLSIFVNSTLRLYLLIFGALIFLPIFISLAVSYYVYDVSGLYNLDWVDGFHGAGKNTIININAGFDETSILLEHKFPNAELLVFDFYDPKKHTEISIKRARKAYPPFPNTKTVTATHLPIADNSADNILVIFAAHEIRNEQERIGFFKELKRIVKPAGQIMLTEHLRDMPNFLAYNIGFFHFYPKKSWLQVLSLAGLGLEKEQKITPFISAFTITKNGIAP